MYENISDKNSQNEIINSITGQRIILIESGSPDLLKMESIYPPFSNEPPLHFHPNQQEHIEVLEGELTVRYIDGIKIYRQGTDFIISAGTAHAMWNSGYPSTRISWRVEPALETENLLRTICRLANSGQTKKDGSPTFLLLVYLLQKYQKCFRLRRPAIAVITILYCLFRPIYYFKKIHL